MKRVKDKSLSKIFQKLWRQAICVERIVQAIELKNSNSKIFRKYKFQLVSVCISIVIKNFRSQNYL